MNPYTSKENFLNYLKHLSINLINDEYHLMLDRYNNLLSIFNKLVGLINSSSSKCNELIKEKDISKLGNNFVDILKESISLTSLIYKDIASLSSLVDYKDILYFETGFDREQLKIGALSYYEEIYCKDNRSTLIYKVKKLLDCYKQFNEVTLYRIFNIYDKENLEYLSKFDKAPSMFFKDVDEDGEIDLIDVIKRYIFNVNNLINLIIFEK